MTPPLATRAQSRPMSQDLASLVAKYDGQAPRYTSYPTAVQFTSGIDDKTYRTWLGELSIDDPVSLYLHIPFCARLCWFCGCNTRAVSRHESIRGYVDNLVSEIGLVRAALSGQLAASAIHLGGGSPNMLSAGELSAIFGALGSAFRIGASCEVSAELDPANVSREWVQAAAAVGLNRASLGVQNLDPRVQQAVNRTETADQVAQAVAWLREIEVRSINIDLMYGLPHQTTANTLATLDLILGLQPDRVALFGYAHVPWMKAHQQLIDEAALPGATARLEQSEAAAERLVAEGYVRIGLDHFARPEDDLAKAQTAGRLRRNFQGYTTDSASALIGLGASAISSLPQGFVQNASQDLAWRIALAQKDLPTARGVARTPADLFRGEIIERLMCDLEVDLGAVCTRHRRAHAELDPERARLEELAQDGLLLIDGDRVVVTAIGRLAIRSICAVFDRYFAPEAGRHAKAL